MQRSMNQTYLIFGIVVLGLSIFVGYQSAQLRFYTRFGPGPGFFPLILSGILGFLALAMIVQSLLRADTLPRGAFGSGDRGGYLRVGALIAVLLGTGPMLDLIGYRITMVVFYFVLLSALGRRGVVQSAALAVAFSLGSYQLFAVFLGVPLPRGPWGF